MKKPIREMPESYESDPPMSKFLGYNDYKYDEQNMPERSSNDYEEDNDKQSFVTSGGHTHGKFHHKNTIIDLNVKINAWHLRGNILINLIMILVVALQLGLLPWLNIDIG